VYGEEGKKTLATVEITCDNKKVDVSLADFFKENSDYSNQQCTIKIGEGYVSYPINELGDKRKPHSFVISNVSRNYLIIGEGREKSFIECPDFNEKDQIILFDIHDTTGKITIKNIGFRNCGEKYQYTSSINVIKKINN